jgi:phage gp29-like protein
MTRLDDPFWTIFDVGLDMPTSNTEDVVLKHYDQIRARFKSQEDSSQPQYSTPLTDKHGFYLNRASLTETITGVDKLFYTLVNGIMDDPDYALKKDSKIYEKMLRDPQIYYCLMVRKFAISSLPWTVVPPPSYAQDPTAIALAEAAERRLQQIPRFTELLDNVLDALLPGLSVNELVWQLKGDQYVVRDHLPVYKDRFKFTKDGILRLLSPRSPTSGEALPPYKFISFTFNTTDGSWYRPEEIGHRYYGRGLADTPLYHYFYFKMLALKYLMKTIERYGMPFKIFYTGSSNAAMASKMDQIMLALKNDSVVGIPGKKGEVDVEVTQSPSKGGQSANIFMSFIAYLDGLITKTILGQELMTEMPSVGSFAAAAVHRSVFGFISNRDREMMKDILNSTLLRFDAQLNTPNIPEELYPQFDFKKSPLEDAAGFLQTVGMAVDLGLPVGERQVREFTGLRAPAMDEQPLVRPPVTTIPGMPGTAEQSIPTTQPKKKDDKNESSKSTSKKS